MAQASVTKRRRYMNPGDVFHGSLPSKLLMRTVVPLNHETEMFCYHTLLEDYGELPLPMISTLFPLKWHLDNTEEYYSAMTSYGIFMERYNYRIMSDYMLEQIHESYGDIQLHVMYKMVQSLAEWKPVKSDYVDMCLSLGRLCQALCRSHVTAGKRMCNQMDARIKYQMTALINSYYRFVYIVLNRKVAETGIVVHIMSYIYPTPPQSRRLLMNHAGMHGFGGKH